MIETGDLIGKPFKYGGRGPDFYDCYGIVLEGMRRMGVGDNFLPPDFESPSNPEDIARIVNSFQKSVWREVEPSEAREGHLVLLRVLGQDIHVGFHLGGNYFIHAWEGNNTVLIERISFWQRKIEGYYEYTG